MLEPPFLGLRLVGPDDLAPGIMECLQPGARVAPSDGTEQRLPEHFYEIPSWEAALDTKLAPNFGLWELIDVDYREAEAARLYPRYVPCAVAVLAGYLQLLSTAVNKVIRVAANGGYRSPSHRLSVPPSTHSWGTAVNIYRVGEEWMDSRESIEKYAAIARQYLPAAWIRPYGEMPGYAFDHLHIDLGYFSVAPNGSSQGVAGAKMEAGQ